MGGSKELVECSAGFLWVGSTDGPVVVTGSPFPATVGDERRTHPRQCYVSGDRGDPFPGPGPMSVYISLLQEILGRAE